MKVLRNIFLGIVAAIVLLGSGLYVWDLVDDRRYEIKILREVPIYPEWEPLNGQEVIGAVRPGEQVKVLRIRYGKDYRAIRVQRENDSTGWLIPVDQVELSK